MVTTTLPADDETERLAKQVAKVTGKSIETILREALAAHAVGLGIGLPARARGRTPKEVRTALEEAAAKFGAMPVLDPRSADEIIDYDELGLPR